MRPDPMQILCNLDFFKQKLTEAGVENAHQKMAQLHSWILEWRNYTGWQVLMERELRNTEQAPLRWPSKRYTPQKERVRMIKRAAPQRKSVLKYRQRAAQTLDKINRKLDAWPAITYNEADLKTTYEGKKNHQRLRKRASRKRLVFKL